MHAPDARRRARCPAHYVVFEDGRIVQCVPEERRAWHAGVSSWAGETDINSRSIGIEIVNPGHEFGYPRFSAAADRGGDLAVQVDHNAPRADQRRPHPRAIPTWRRRASRIPAKNFPGSCLSNPASVTGCAPRRSISTAACSSRATAAKRSRAATHVALPMATASRKPAFMTMRHARRRHGVPAPFPPGARRWRRRPVHAADIAGAASRPRPARSRRPVEALTVRALDAGPPPPFLARQSAGRPLRANAERRPGRKVRAPWTNGAG